MGIKNTISQWWNSVPNIKNEAQDQTAQELERLIVQRQLDRYRQDIKRWRSAIDRAESKIMPDRVEIIRVYKDVILDAHLQAQMNTRINRVCGLEFEVKNIDGSKNEEAETVLKNKWFCDLIYEILLAKFYGYSLIQLGNIKNGTFESVSSLPREYIIPDYEAIKKDLYNPNDLIYFNKDKKYSKWLVWIDTKELGLLNSACPCAIYKKNSMAQWGQYLELFGMPIRVGRTNIADPKRRSQMDKMLANIGSASWATLDKDDMIEFIETSASQPSHDDFIERCNSELSKLIVGQKMTADDGSSRSQSETHLKIFDQITYSDIKFVENEVSKLMPRFAQFGLFQDGLKFELKKDEQEINVNDRVDHIEKLSKYYTITPEIVEEYTGISIESEKQNKSVMTDVANMYDEYKNFNILNPFANEHAARIINPDKFIQNSFRRKNIETGIDIIIGKLINQNTMTTQAYRFSVNNFTVEQAKQWLKYHDIKYILFEEASNG